MTITIDRDSFHTASFDARRIFMAGLAGVMTYGALSLWAVSCGNLGAYILVAKGSSDDVYMIGRIAVSQMQGLITAYKERFDRNNFFQNLLLDNLLLVDIYNRAKKLHVEVVQPRAVFLIETRQEKDSTVTELLKGMFTSQAGDYITADPRADCLQKSPQ